MLAVVLPQSMKKFFRLIVIMFFGLVCRSAGAAELQAVTVALVSPSWNTGLPTAVARGAGFFKEEALDVSPVTLSSSGPIMMALLMSGQADFVIAGAVAILRGIARGAPVVVVGGHLNRMSYALMADKRLKTVADLKGKTIGITGIGGMGEFTVVESLLERRSTVYAACVASFRGASSRALASLLSTPAVSARAAIVAASVRAEGGAGRAADLILSMLA